MASSAYDSILEYSGIKQFGDFRRVLVGNRGTIANGNLVKGMSLVFDKKNQSENESLFDDLNEEKEPINIVQKLGGRPHPGLLFDKSGYEEVMRQVESRGEISLMHLIDKLKFLQESDEEIWQKASETVKRRCLSRNIDKLLKDTKPLYRMYGDNMHYLTVGLVEVETYQAVTERYPLFLFSCPDLDIKKLSAKIDTTGFMNFWLDKNIFENEIGRKRNNNFEVTLDNSFASQINTFSTYMNGINLAATYKSVKVDPTYMALQIVTGFEAEYIDPVWQKILTEGGNNE
jgi:hypothetical protein